MRASAEILPCSFGLGLIYFPRIAMYDRENALSALVLGVVLAVLAVCVCGRAVTGGKVVSVLLFLECVFAGGMYLRIYSEMIKTVLLPEYKIFVTAAAMLLTALYGAAKGRAAGQRFALLVIPVLIAAAIICFLPSAKDMDIKNIRFIPSMPQNVAAYSVRSAFLLSFPLVAYTAQKRKNIKNTAAFIGLSGGFAVSAAFIWLSRFNYMTEQPVLDLMYAGDSASSFIRRQEGLILGIVTVCAYFLMELLISCAADPEGKGGAKTGSYAVCAGLMLIFAVSVNSVKTAEFLFDIAVYIGVSVFLILLSAVYFLKKFYKRRYNIGRKSGIAVSLLLAALTGCAGKDPEKRDYALGLFVRGDGSVSAAAAKLSKNGDNTNEYVFYEGMGATLEEAAENAASKTGNNLYFGHLVLCVIDKSALNEKYLDELGKMFLYKEEFGRNVWVMAAENVEDIEKAAENGENMTAFAEKYYGRNGEYAKKGKTVDINRLLYLSASGRSAEIPRVVCVDGRPEISGEIIIYNKKGNKNEANK